MKVLVLVVLAAMVTGAAAAAEQLGLPVPLRGRKYRAFAVLAIFPIALLCALAAGYGLTAWAAWLSVLLTPIIVGLGVALAIFLVGRILPEKISSRGERD